MTSREIVADLLLDARVHLGEGPIWHPERSLLSWVEIFDGRINWLGLDGTAGRTIDLGRRVGAALPTTDGALALATEDGFARLEDDGTFELLAEIETDRNSFMNDGKCDALGRFWAGTIGVGDDGIALTAAGSLYRLDHEGKVARVLSGLSISNGLDWSPDDGTFYYIDSGAGGIDAYPFDLETGRLGPPRRIIEIPFGSSFADGMCVDTDGCLWVAVWGLGEVRRYRADGRFERAVRVPVTQPTSCIFAGPELDVLVITSASRGLSPEELAEQPHAGSLFCCRPGATGLPAHPFPAARSH